MIIHRLTAENVLKYTNLTLAEIPEQGLMAISGENESGKSTIGETIALALFGRTFSLAETDVIKVIRWGETRCSVTLEFSVAKGERYEIARYLDNEGGHGARLSVAGQESPLARGAAQVRAALEELIGFGYAEFIESFYLAQREITTPHPHSAAVKSMAGVAALERVQAELEEGIRRESDAIVETEEHIGDLNMQLAELNIRDVRLSDLESERHAIEAAQAESSQQEVDLVAVSARSQDTVLKLSSAAEPLLDAGMETSHESWRDRAARFVSGLDVVEPQCRGQQVIEVPLREIRGFAQQLQERLGAFGELREQAAAYRHRLAQLLGESPLDARDTEGMQQPLPLAKADLTERMAKVRSSRGAARGGFVIFLILGAIAWGLWGLLTQVPDAQTSEKLAAWLLSNIADWEQRFQPWLLPAAGVLTFVLLMFWIRSASLGSTVSQLQQTSQDLEQQFGRNRADAEWLDALDAVSLPKALALLQGVEDEALSAQASQLAQGRLASLLGAEGLGEHREQLRALLAGHEAAVTNARGDISAKIADLHDTCNVQKNELAHLGRAIEEEQARRRRARDLLEMVAGFQSKIAHHRREIEIRDVACELLMGAYRHTTQRFNRDVSSLVGKTLPLLTDGRYEHLSIDENLTVRVFSREKRDFMDLDEISSGTQRQIMLAARLALSQELIKTAIQGPQFIFLDEPFAFFDEQRMRNSLAVLPKLSEDITQIWIIAQEFPADTHFDLNVRCRRGTKALEIEPGSVVSATDPNPR